MQMKKLILTGILGLSLIASTTSAQTAWQLPNQGKQFDDTEKQIYVADKMNKFFNKQLSLQPFTVPDNWQYETFEIEGIKMERLINKKSKSNKVSLQLHGGGYVSGMSDLYRELAIKQAVLSDSKEIYMVNYRLAPQNKYPSALEDAVKIYNHILKQTNSRNIIVFGDSAGGNLALELSLYLKEKNIPQPSMLILASPWTTLETNMPSRQNNNNSDLILGKSNKFMNSEVANPSYGDNLPLNSSKLSPIYADLRNLPPILIQVGGYELFLDEGVELLKKAANDEVDVTLTVYRGMSHDFALLLPELQDSIDSFTEIRDFINRHK